MKFYVGLHQPSDARHFARCMVSVNRLRGRRSDFEVGEWMMDSGAFTEVTKHGGFRHPPTEYADQVRRWTSCGQLVAAVSQDYMCEPFALEATGHTVAEHQKMTVERYDAILAALDASTYLMPVLQGFQPPEYVDHVRMYGDRLGPDMWVGVGSVCKRNGSVAEIEDVLIAIKRERPDLRLHGFGLKLTAMTSGVVRGALYSSDSMAWSYSARMQGRNGNDWREAKKYAARIQTQPVQLSLLEPGEGA